MNGLESIGLESDFESDGLEFMDYQNCLNQTVLNQMVFSLNGQFGFWIKWSWINGLPFGLP